jgi:hypothetical protein
VSSRRIAHQREGGRSNAFKSMNHVLFWPVQQGMQGPYVEMRMLLKPATPPRRKRGFPYGTMENSV